MTTDLLQIQPAELRFVCKSFFLFSLKNIDFRIILLCFSKIGLSLRMICNDDMTMCSLSFFNAVELKKQSSCLVQLENMLDQYIAFKVSSFIVTFFFCESKKQNRMNQMLMRLLAGKNDVAEEILCQAQHRHRQAE